MTLRRVLVEGLWRPLSMPPIVAMDSPANGHLDQAIPRWPCTSHRHRRGQPQPVHLPSELDAAPGLAQVRLRTSFASFPSATE